MIFSLDVRRARKGDCLLLHFGSKANPGLIMIDGGPKSVWKLHLKPRLLEIRKARGLQQDQPLPVDALMVSHIDDDHIQGILDFTKEERARVAQHKPRLLRIFSLWHNSFDDLIKQRPIEATAAAKMKFGAAAVSGGADLPYAVVAAIENGIDKSQKPFVESTLMVLASVEQGYRLRSDAEGLGYDRNVEFGKGLIMARKGAKPVMVGRQMKFTLIGPMQQELEKLQRDHVKWLKKLKEKGSSAAEVLAAYVDRSVPNLSSLVFLVEADSKKMLLTGDARGDKIIEGMQLVGLLAPGKTSKINVDLLKVPHHGSSNNLDSDFFVRIVARHYVFSGDGVHGNPDRESLQMLLKARGVAADYEVHLTYPVDEIDVERKKEWEKKSVWRAKDHSLKALFDANPKFKAKVRIVDATKAHVIDLGDPLKKAFPSLG